MNVRTPCLVLAGSLALSVSCSREPEPEPASERVAASASAPSSAPQPPDTELPSSLRSDIAAMDLRTAELALSEAASLLDDTLALAAPDCERARFIVERNCELANHICRLGDEQGAAPEPNTRCRDARKRCGSARDRVTARCP